MAKHFKLLMLFGTVALLSIIFSLNKGSTPYSLFHLLYPPSTEEGELARLIFWQLRLPRTLTAFTAGGLLALAGVLIQLLLRNPLADPFVLGLSGGAALLSLVLLLLGFSLPWLVGGAWVGSLAAMLLVFMLARQRQWHPDALLLSGIAIAYACAAGISFILFISPETRLHGMLFWLLGDLNTAGMPWFALTVLGLGLIGGLLLAPGMNILGQGDKEAHVVGLSVRTYRLLLFFLSSLLTATAVTLVGSIGFIGLMVPHMTRLLAGYDHRLVLPLSLLLGGSVLTLADTLARSLLTLMPLPTGLIMAFLGVPFFLFLMRKA